ncbi:MAG: hypothetical protein GF401_11700 [Chitinivibrionales bacterium]|nr:hypothetical protein [Chitinivibrionales bacterium]
MTTRMLPFFQNSMRRKGVWNSFFACIVFTFSLSGAWGATYDVGDGKAFATIAEAITQCKNDHGGNLSGQGEQHILLYPNDGSDAPWTYDENIDLSGFSNTSASDYIRISVADGYRHNGVAGSGVVLHGYIFFNELNPAYTKIEWLEITGPDATGSDNDAAKIDVSANWTIDHCIIHDDGSSDVQGVFIGSGSDSVTVKNSIIYNMSGCGIQTAGAEGLEFLNNTIYNCISYGVRITNNSIALVRNVIAVDNGGGEDPDFYANSSTWESQCSHNLSSDESAPGDDATAVYDAIASDLFLSTELGSEDLHIQVGSPAQNAGTTLSGGGTDIDGQSRSGTWDIGADEIPESNQPPGNLSITPSDPQTIAQGGSVTFTVSADGATPFTYEWTKGGEVVGNSASLQITDAATIDEGTYTVTVSNSWGSDQATTSQLTVIDTVVITVQPSPSDTGIPVGGSVTYSVTATGEGAIQYDWRKDGVSTGETNSNITISNAQASDAGGYTCRAYNSVSEQISQTATLAVAADAPSNVTITPGNSTIEVGESITFTASADGATPFTYQWYLNGNAIETNGTSSSYTVQNATTGNSGTYTVTVGNSAGSETSTGVILNVLSAPDNVVLNPGNSTIAEGDSFQFTTSVTGGTPPFTYTWYRDGNMLSGETAQSLTLDAASVNDNGVYQVRGGPAGISSETASNTVTLTVVDTIEITQQPQSASRLVGESHTLSVVASGGGTLAYQWYKNGNELSGETGSDLSLSSLQLTDAGNYHVRITNSVDTALSNTATISVGTMVNPPSITQHPQPATRGVGSSVSLYAQVSGTSEPFTFQWFKGSTAITTASNPTADDSVYVDNNLTKSDSASYSVRVANSEGMVTSQGALITVLDTVRISSISPSNATREVTESVSFSVTAYGDSLSYQWRKDGTPLSGENSETLQLSNLSDTGTFTYTCRVYNSVSEKISDAALLTVSSYIEPPQITSQPQSDSVVEFSAATFSVIATGTSPNYQWFRGGDTIPGAMSSTYTDSLVTASKAGQYTVHVWNSKDTVVSSAATLTVTPKAPEITRQPNDTMIAESTTAVFRADADGSAQILYTWYKVGAGEIAGGSKELTLSNVPASDNEAKIYCILSNSAGSAVTDTATLRVIEKARAGFTVSDSAGFKPAVIHVTDNSTGDIDSVKWYASFEGVDIDSIVYRTSSSISDTSFTFRDSGVYRVRLVVIGAPLAGNDTAYSPEISIYGDIGENPVTISNARYVSSTSIELTFDNFGIDSVRRGFPPPYATGLGVWYGKNGRSSIDTAEASMLTSFELSSLDSDPVRTITVEAPSGPADTVYGFWVSPLWNTGPSKFNLYNTGALKMVPVNDLNVSGRYAGNIGSVSDVVLNTDSLDNAVISIGNAGSIDTPGVTGVVVRYAFGADVQEQDTVPSDDFLSNSPANTYRWTLKNPGFYNENTGSDTQTVTISVRQLSANGYLSPAKESSFIAGWPPPHNPYELGITKVDAGGMTLKWNAVSSMDSVRLVYRADTEVPEGRIPYTLSQDEYIVVGLSPSDSLLDVAVGPATRYYFAIQGMKNLLWSDITSQATATDSTPDYDPQAYVENTSQIDSLRFDSTTNHLIVDWSCRDLSEQITYHLGITVGVNEDTANIKEPVPPQYGKLIILESSVIETSGRDTIKLGDTFEFNTLYWTALWLRSSNGPWSSPTNKSVASITSPDFSSQEIEYFVTDTVWFFNNKGLFFKDENYKLDNVIFTETVGYYNTGSIGADYVPVSIGFTLKTDHDAYQPFNVGFKIDSLPDGYGWNDIGIYRDSGGVLLVEYGFVVNPAESLVYVNTDNFIDDVSGDPFSFVAMVDKVKPAVTLPESIDDPVDPSKAIYDTIHVEDNAANVRWKLIYATDGDVFLESYSISGIVDGTVNGEVIDSIPAMIVSEENGVRALFIVTDGVHSDTFNVSRRALRDNSDFVTTETMQWSPLSVTAYLENPEAGDALTDLTGDANEWKYNKSDFRIFRWVPYKGNAGSEKKWVEYSAEHASFFRFEPGRLIWVKTREARPLGFGSGVTVSQKEPFEIVLPPNEWTDFALPFKYDITVGDILETTGKDNDEALEFYFWSKFELKDLRNARAEIYRSEALYIKGIPGLDELSERIEKPNLTGHTVYNRSGQEVILKIPPLPVAASNYRANPTKKLNSDKGWSIRVIPQTKEGVRLSSVYCGYREGKGEVTYLSMPPSFSNVSLGVGDTKGTGVYGHCVVHTKKDGVCTYRLVVRNKSATTDKITGSLHPLGDIPNGYQMKILNPASRTWEQNEQNEFSVDIGGNAHEYRILAVGNAQSLEKFQKNFPVFRMGFIGAYPNPFKRAVKIVFSVPYKGVSKLELRMFNAQGRLVWGHDLTRFNPGINTHVWRPGRSNAIGGGVYFLTVKAIGPGGKIIGNFKTPMTYLK